MKKVEQEEFLNNLAFEVPNVPEDWLIKKIKFKEVDKKTQGHRNRFYKNILYVYKDIPFVFEICYSYNEDFTKYAILGQKIISAAFESKIFTNVYYVMGCGYKPNFEYNFKRRGRLSYWMFDAISYDYAYKGKNFMRKVYDLEDVLNPLYETMYKEKLSHLNKFVINTNTNKPYVATGMDSYMSKEQFNEFSEWVKGLRNFDINLYKDFLKLAKNKNHNNIFVNNWLELHDLWSGIKEQRENEKIAKKDIEVWNKEVKKSSEIDIIKIESKYEMIEFGNEMNNCLIDGGFDYKTIYKVVSWKTRTPLALCWDKKEIEQLYGYKNKEVSETVHQLVRKAMGDYLKERG